MTTLISAVNGLFRPLFDLLFLLLGWLPWWLALSVIAFAVTIPMLWVVRVTSNQAKLETAKHRMQAAVFEIRLFNDDARLIGLATVQAFWHSLRYVGLMFVPLLWMFLPFVILITHMQGYFGYQTLVPGEPVLLKVVLDVNPDSRARPDIKLELPEGLKQDGPAVWLPRTRTMVWRLLPNTRAVYDIALLAENTRLEKTLTTETAPLIRRSPVRTRDPWTLVAYPYENPLPADGRIDAISVNYPGNTLLLGAPAWIWLFILLTIAFAFALRKPMRVVI